MERVPRMADVVVVGASNFVQALVLALIFIPLIMMWVFALADLFRREDIGGATRVLWLFAIIVLPLLGVIIYFLVWQPTEKEQRAMAAAAPTAGGSTSDELERLAGLHEKGTIDDEEYKKLKGRVIG